MVTVNVIEIFTILVWILFTTVTACDPTSSVLDTYMETVSGSNCYFPFKDTSGTTHTECVSDTAGDWCAITCDYPTDLQKDVCKWPKSSQTLSGCSGLPGASVSYEPKTATGHSKCTFPFYYQGNCYTDCTMANAASYWCSKTDYYVSSYADCQYTLSALASPECANWTASVSTAEPYRYGSNSNNQCVFPFVDTDKCYNQCVKGASNSLWCSTSKDYGTDALWTYCQYYAHINSFPAPLSWGFYRIYIETGCPSTPACGKQVFFSDQKTSLLGTPNLVAGNTAIAHDHIFEVIPQPNNTVLIRTPQECNTAPGAPVYHFGANYDASFNVEMNSYENQRTFWDLTGANSVFKVNRYTVGGGDDAFWHVSDDGTFYNLILRPTTSDVFRFTQVTTAVPTNVNCNNVASNVTNGPTTTSKTTVPASTTTTSTTTTSTTASSSNAPSATKSTIKPQRPNFALPPDNGAFPLPEDKLLKNTMIALGVILFVTLIVLIVVLRLICKRRS